MIHLMHLEKCADTMMGSPTEKGGVSGGERKRTSIGMELITNPAVLFLDEPTTGLDTYTAFSIMDTLHSLAAAGRTVVTTIHQPSSDMFHLFDDLLILAEGQIVYQGPRTTSVGYFGQIGYLSNPKSETRKPTSETRRLLHNLQIPHNPRVDSVQALEGRLFAETLHPEP